MFFFCCFSGMCEHVRVGVRVHVIKAALPGAGASPRSHVVQVITFTARISLKADGLIKKASATHPSPDGAGRGTRSS